MRPLLAGAVLLVLVAAPAAARADALADARRFYNQGQYDLAERMAREAIKVGPADGARVVLGRIQLERYRRSAAPADLADARACLRQVDPAALDAQERVELVVGFAEALFLDEQFSAAAELFATVLDSSTALGAPAHERVLDWWGTALDRHAQSRPAADRGRDYERLLQRMIEEIAKDPGSTPASYWIAAAARGAGDPERAYQAAVAGWLRAPLTRDRGAALRADLERLVTQGIIPERAAKVPQRDRVQTIAAMQGEWEAFKAKWAK